MDFERVSSKKYAEEFARELRERTRIERHLPFDVEPRGEVDCSVYSVVSAPANRDHRTHRKKTGNAERKRRDDVSASKC